MQQVADRTAPQKPGGQRPGLQSAVSTAYFVLIREMRDAYNHSLRLVESARQRGIKPTARLFQTTPPTVRKWLRRFQQLGPRGLVELSRAPHHHPTKPAPRSSTLMDRPLLVIDPGRANVVIVPLGSRTKTLVLGKVGGLPSIR